MQPDESRPLVAVDDVLTTSYGTGPYRVAETRNYGRNERWSLLCIDFDEDPGTKPHLFLNYCFACGGRIFKP